MKLWSGTLSPFSAKVRIVLAEKNLPVALAEIPWSRANLWGPKPEEFLAVSPLGQVPVLVVGEKAVVDSTLIIEYLEDAHPDPALMPADPLDRADCRYWEDRADQLMAAQLTTLIRELFMKVDGAGRDDAAVATAFQAYSSYLTALEARLSDADYLSGRYGVADIASWVGLAFAQTLGVSLAQFPAVKSWYERVAARPVIAAEYQQIMAAAAAA